MTELRALASSLLLWLSISGCSRVEPIQCNHDLVFAGIYQLVGDYKKDGGIESFLEKYREDEGIRWIKTLRHNIMNCHAYDTRHDTSKQPTFMGLLPQLELIRTSIPKEDEHRDIIVYKIDQIQRSLRVLETFIQDNSQKFELESM